MLTFTPHMRILVAAAPLDMRKGIDGMIALCRLCLKEDPMSGAVFIFTSRVRRHLRVLTYDGQGFWCCTKRLSSGRFPYWPQPGGALRWLEQFDACQAQALIHGGDPMSLKRMGPWKKISYSTPFLTGVA